MGFLKLFNMKSTWTLEEAATKLSPVDTGEDKLKTRVGIHDLCLDSSPVRHSQRIQIDWVDQQEPIHSEGWLQMDRGIRIRSLPPGDEETSPTSQ